MITFGCSSTLDQRYENAIKRVILSLKQRDVIDEQKRSVCYCLILKTLLSISKIDGLKAMRLLATTSADVQKVPELKDLALSESEEDPDNMARLALILRFTKLFQSSLLLYINSSKANELKNGPSSGGKLRDEIAYALMVEDFSKESLKVSSRHYLMGALPQLIASGFLSVKTKDAMIRSFERLVQSAQDPSDSFIEEK